MNNDTSTKEIDPKFLCPICQNIFENPLILNICQHTFCKLCIESTIKFQKGNNYK